MTLPRAVLWDMDGTLIDSAEDHWQAWVEVIAEEGLTITRENFTAMFGRRNVDIVQSFLGDVPQGKMEYISKEKERRYREVVRRRGTATVAGALECVERLAAAGWRQAIATAAPRDNATTVMEVLGIGSRFGAIVAAEDVHVGKPDPMVFLVAAERLGVEPRRSIVCEDAPAGIEGARRAGMRSVGVCTLHPSLAADVAITSFHDLPNESFEKLLA